MGLAAALAWLALVEAMLGRADARTHGPQSLQIAEQRGDRWNEVRARAGLGLDALAHGDLAVALDWLQPAAEILTGGRMRHPNVFRIHGDLIETQMRMGKRSDAAQQLARLLEDAALTKSRCVGARCRAMLAADTDTDEAFAAALELHKHDPSDWERARTQLLYANGYDDSGGAGSPASNSTQRSRPSTI